MADTKNMRAAGILLISIMLVLSACNRQSDSQATPIDPPTTTVTAPPTGPALETLLDTPVDPSAVPAAAPHAEAVAEPEVIILAPTPTPPNESSTEAAAPTPTAQPRGRVSATLVNVRAAPEMNGALIATVQEGTELAVLGRSGDGRWLQVCCVGNTEAEQWINREFLDVDTSALLALAPDSADGAQSDATDSDRATAIVAVSLANVRGGPGTNYPVTQQATQGQALNIVGRNDAGDWIQICCVSTDPQQQSWLAVELVEVRGELETVARVEAPEAPVLAAAAPATGGAVDVAAAPAPGLPGPGGFGAPGGANPFTGQPLSGDAAARRPVVVCINNDFAARPQFGISQADVMYEYLMEGFGITRFSGIFYGDNVAQIGPVRSARLINYYLGALHEAGLLCSGASDQVRYTLKHEAPFPYLDIDLDDPSNARYSTSIGRDYRTRLRTASDKIVRWLNDWGVQQPAAVRGFFFGSAPGGGQTASTVRIPYPSATGSNVSYSYDAGSGRYLRSLGSAPHLDGNTGAQVGVENVVVQYVPHQITDIVEDSLGSLSIRLNLFGSGRALVFRDGQAFEGSWQSNSRGDTPRFFDGNGNEIPLKPGRTWISIVPPDYAIAYE